MPSCLYHFVFCVEGGVVDFPHHKMRLLFPPVLGVEGSPFHSSYIVTATDQYLYVILPTNQADILIYSLGPSSAHSSSECLVDCHHHRTQSQQRQPSAEEGYFDTSFLTLRCCGKQGMATCVGNVCHVSLSWRASGGGGDFCL